MRPGGGLTLRGQVVNAGAAPLADVEVVATLQRRTTSRVDFQEAVAGAAGARSSVATATVQIGPLGPGDQVPVELSRTAEELGLGAVRDRVAGVYPLRLQVQAAGEVLHEIRTGVVVLPELVGEPVRTALLVPIDSPVAVDGASTAAADPLAGGLTTDARLPGLADALAGSPDLPLTVATSGLVLEAAADAADGFQRQDAAGTVIVEPDALEARRAASLLTDLQQILRRPAVEHLALPYASADLVALVRAGQAAAARDAIGDGVLSAEAATGTRPAPGVLWPPDALDNPTLEAVVAGLDLVVLDPATLGGGPPEEAELTPPAVRRLRTPNGPAVTALTADPWLTPLLAGRDPTPDSVASETAAPWPGEDGAALAAQRVMAETAALYFEAPFAPAPRGLLLAPPLLWDPSPEALGALLDGLAAAAWLRPVTVPDLAAQVPAPAEPASLTYPQAARERELPRGYLDQVGEARETVGSLATLLAAGADPVGPQRLVAVASSIHYRGRPQEGLALLDAVNQTAQAVFDGVEIVDSPAFTLTGTDGGQIPLEVRNSGPAPVEVEVGMASARFTVDAPQQRVTLQPDETARVVFTVRALTPGVTAPLDASVTAADGGRVLDRAQVVIRARTSSVTAVVLMVGAGTVLAVWWFRDARRRRREGRSPVTTPA